MHANCFKHAKTRASKSVSPADNGSSACETRTAENQMLSQAEFIQKVDRNDSSKFKFCAFIHDQKLQGPKRRCWKINAVSVCPPVRIAAIKLCKTAGTYFSPSSVVEISWKLLLYPWKRNVFDISHLNNFNKKF